VFIALLNQESGGVYQTTFGVVEIANIPKSLNPFTPPNSSDNSLMTANKNESASNALTHNTIQTTLPSQPEGQNYGAL